MDINTILTMNCKSLKEALSGLGLITTGRKDELRNRLLRHHGLSAIDDGEEEVEARVATGNNDESVSVVDGESVDEPISLQSEDVGIHSARRVRHSQFTLRDVEDSLTHFSGTGPVMVDAWVREFEDTAATIGWDDLQCYVFGKQLLKGAARSFVRSQAGLNLVTIKRGVV